MDFGENGRPAYHPKVLLKLFIYGYLNNTRSSRVLEKECRRNVEVMWLMEGFPWFVSSFSVVRVFTNHH
jgi:transposase